MAFLGHQNSCPNNGLQAKGSNLNEKFHSAWQTSYTNGDQLMQTQVSKPTETKVVESKGYH